MLVITDWKVIGTVHLTFWYKYKVAPSRFLTISNILFRILALLTCLLSLQQTHLFSLSVFHSFFASDSQIHRKSSEKHACEKQSEEF
ncbi:hypothetical protein CFP56_011097 [Quercus suber]|uniref:Uncharacterized protein n=1 Tax=Quercus suber TaxID=58331 RepID=A0AAW0L092_QUESU|nr:hypothetical protein CFP56_12515 [Quercus suber]